MDWLVEDSHFVVIGQLYPGWLLKKGLLGVIERDQAAHYYISNEDLGLYAVGLTQEEAEADFKHTIIDNYRRLEKGAKEDLDLKILLSEYQKYLERADNRLGRHL
jgi:hypothetical protein